MSAGNGGASAIGWLVIAVIAVFVVPRLVNMLFAGVGDTAGNSARFYIATDPIAAAEANLASAINSTGGFGW